MFRASRGFSGSSLAPHHFFGMPLTSKISFIFLSSFTRKFPRLKAPRSKNPQVKDSRCPPAPSPRRRNLGLVLRLGMRAVLGRVESAYYRKNEQKQLCRACKFRSIHGKIPLLYPFLPGVIRVENAPPSLATKAAFLLVFLVRLVKIRLCRALPVPLMPPL